MARTTRKKNTPVAPGKLRTAACCENCFFGGFKVSGYSGAKRQTGLCTKYQSTPAINYHFDRAYHWDGLIQWLHNDLRSHDAGDILLSDVMTFEQVIAAAPRRASNLKDIMMSYFRQKDRRVEFEDLFGPLRPWHSGFDQIWDQWGVVGLNGSGFLWADDLPCDLTLEDWPQVLLHLKERGGDRNGLSRILTKAAERGYVDHLELLRLEHQQILDYHRAWRDYFAHSEIQKIKRSTVCDDHTPVKGKIRRDCSNLYNIATPPTQE